MAKVQGERGGDATGQLGNQARFVIDSVQARQPLFLANELRCLLVSMANSLLSTHMPQARGEGDREGVREWKECVCECVGDS